MDIKKQLLQESVLYWVEEVHTSQDGSTELWGIAMSDGDGFGLPNANDRSFHGEIACISTTQYWKANNITISRAHLARNGFYWRIAGQFAAPLPPPPFLITNAMSLRLVCKEEVFFHPNRKWADLYDENLNVVDFQIWCQDYIGVLIVDKSHSIERGILFAFSDLANIRLSPSQKLYFTVDPDDAFGSVEPVTNH